MSQDSYWARFQRNRVTRRRVLQRTAWGGGALATAALVGCGDDDDAAEPTSGGAGNTPEPTQAPQGYETNFPEPSGQPKTGGTLRVANDWDVSILDPIKTAAGGTIVKCNIVYNRLINLNSGVTAPDDREIKLVSDLSGLPEQPDERTYTFKIDPNANFHDIAPLSGRTLTADDVKYAYERFATAQGSVHTSYFRDVDKVEAIDEKTLKITLKTPSPDFLIPLGTRYLTIHPRELVEGGTIDTQAIGTGPMILKELVKSDHVTFEANKDYFKGAPYLDGAEFKITPDAATRLAAFRAGQVEFSYGLLGSQRDADNLKQSNPDTKFNISEPFSATFSLALNLENPLFTDPRVRQALMLGMDRETMVDIIYDGAGTTNPTIPWSYLYETEPAPEEYGQWWAYDPTRAKQLLEQAGASNLSFTVIYHEYSASGNTQQLETMSNLYKEIGVDMKVQRVPYTEFNSQWIQRTFPEAADGWQALGFEPNNYFYNHLHSTSPGNRWRIKDTQIDQWADAQRTELDVEARKELWKQIWDRVLDQAYRIDKPSGTAFTAYQSWVNGLRFGGPLGSNSSYYDWGQQIHLTWLADH